MGKFEQSFAARSTHVQPAANTNWFSKLNAGDKLVTGIGEGVGAGHKLIGTICIIAGTAMLVGGEPFSGIKGITEGLAFFMVGNTIRSTCLTYGQSIAKGDSGAKESGTEIVRRLGQNFKGGLLRPW
jgi:hypothetical protein